VTIKQQQLRTPKSEPKKKGKNPKWGHKGAKRNKLRPRAPQHPPITSKKRMEKHIVKCFSTSFDERLLERLVTQCPLFLEPRGALGGCGRVGHPPK